MKLFVKFGIITACVVSFKVMAYETAVIDGRNWYYEIQEDADKPYAVIVAGRGYSGNFTVPDAISGYPVTVIGNNAFSNPGVISVVIPAGVKTISAFAFQSNTALKSVVIGAGVTNIQKRAFYGCSKLTEVEILSSNVCFGEECFLYANAIQNLKVFGDVDIQSIFPSSFGRIQQLRLNEGTKIIRDKLLSSNLYKELREVVIPDSVKQIGVAAFMDCSYLTNVVFGSGVSIISSKAFANCKRLCIDELPKSVTNIGDSAFEGCENLCVKTIPNGVVSIGSSCFCGCDQVREISIPAGVKTIPPLAFSGCSITNVSLGLGLEEIGARAFYNCLLTDISLPDSVDRIGDEAFSRNPLRIVRLSENVSTLGSGIFSGCSNIVSVAVTDAMTSFASLFSESLSQITNVELVGEFKAIPDSYFCGAGHVTHVELPPTLEHIGAKAFYECFNLENIVIPSSVTSIGGYCFYACTKLKAIDIPDSVCEIGEGAFFGCSSLSDVRLSNNLTELPMFSFKNCKSLTTLVLPESVKNVGYASLIGCNMSSITFPSGLRIIDKYALADNLFTSICIPNCVTNIGYRAFGGCKKITSIEIPPCVTCVSNVFPQCYPGIEHVVMSGNWKNIGRDQFAGCSMLKRVNIPSSVSSIGNAAFKGCVKIQDLVIPINVAAISEEMCLGCISLTNVTICGKVTKFARRCFSECSKLSSISIPPSTKTLYADAFKDCVSLKAVYIDDVEKWCAVSFNNTAANPLKYGHNLYLKGVLVNNLEIPNGVTNVSANAFYNCQSITSVVLPNSIMRIGENAFCGCSNIKGVYVPEVDTLCEIIFANRFSNPLTIGHNLYVSGVLKNTIALSVSPWPYAFSGASINGVEFLHGVERVWGYAFDNCSQLTKVKFHSELELSELAFSGCENIVDIYGCLGWSLQEKFPIVYANIRKITINNTVAEIGFGQYKGCSQLGSVVFEDNSIVTNISNDAFYGCERLTEVSIPDSVQRIGENAFYGCTSLSSLKIGNGVRRIDSCAFYGCNLLERYRTQGLLIVDGCILNGNTDVLELVIPNGCRLIAENAFMGEQVFTSVVMPATLRYAGKNAFGNCNKIVNLVTAIDNSDGVFSQIFESAEDSLIRLCFLPGAKDVSGSFPNLEILELPVTVTKLSTTAFSNCKKLRSMTIPPFITEGWYNADGNVSSVWLYFKDAVASITNIVIASEAYFIHPSTFHDCLSLKSVTIPASVQTIGAEAFYRCSRLERVIFEGNAPSVGAGTSDRDKVFPKDVCVYVRRSSVGWGCEIPGNWGVYKIFYIDEQDPIPELPKDPTCEQISEALSGSVDAKLAENITNAVNYNAFRVWAQTVKDAGGDIVGAAAVKKAPNAWLSYALGQGALLVAAPTDEDLTVETFTPSTESGRFDFIVSVKDIEVGSEATKENLKKVFGLEGAATLDGAAFSSDKVDIEFATPVDGKVKFTAGPKDANVKAFFMKVKLNP